MKLKPEEIADLYSGLQADSISFETYADPRLSTILAAAEITRIESARQIHEFVTEVESSGAAGFDIAHTGGYITATKLSRFYPKIGQFQSIVNSLIRYSEEVECFHQICADIGMAMLVLPDDPSAPVFRLSRYRPNESLVSFLGMPTPSPDRYGVVPPSNNQNQMWNPQFEASSGYAGVLNNPGGILLNGASAFNELVRRLRKRLVSREYKTDVYARDHQTTNLLESCGTFIDSILAEKIPVFRVFSIDFSYALGSRDSIDLAHAQKDTAKLLAHKKLAARLGYVRKRQFGLTRRHYFHMKIFFEAGTTTYEQQLSEIKLAWQNDVTGGHGIAYDCSDSLCTWKRTSGKFLREDSKFRDRLLLSMDYLCYSELIASVDNSPGRVKPIVTGGQTGAKRKR